MKSFNEWRKLRENSPEEIDSELKNEGLSPLAKGWYSPNYVYYPVKGEHSDLANIILNHSKEITPNNIENFSTKNRRLKPLDGLALGFEELALLMRRGWLRTADGGRFIQVAKWDEKTKNLVDQFLSEFRVKSTVIDVGPDPTRVIKSINYELDI